VERRSPEATRAQPRRHGVHLPMQTLNINQLDPKFLSLGAALNTRVPNPFFGIIPPSSSAVGASTVPQVQLLKPFPQYNNVLLSALRCSWLSDLINRVGVSSLWDITKLPLCLTR
jgi:hypothetical protein